MKSKFILLVLLSISHANSFTINFADIKNFARGFLLSNVLKSLEANENITIKHKNIISAAILGGYISYKYATSPEEDKTKNSLCVISGIGCGHFVEIDLLQILSSKIQELYKSYYKKIKK